MAHDDIPYKSAETDDVYKFVKDQGRFLATKRTSGVSTSDLITRIVRDYDLYLRRNLERGVSAKDLNISFLKESELQVKKSMSEIAEKIQKTFKEGEDSIKSMIKDGEDSIKTNWESTREDFTSSLHFWEEKSQELIKDFILLFDPVAKLWKNLKSSSEDEGSDDDGEEERKRKNRTIKDKIINWSNKKKKIDHE